MKVLVKDMVEVESIDLIATDTTQVEVQKELALAGLFKLYIHQDGKTIIRICKIRNTNIQWASNLPAPRPKDESPQARHHETNQKFVDFAKLEQQMKDATGSLPNYRREATWNYINALKNEIIRLMGEVDGIAESNSKLREQIRSVQ